MELTSNVRSYLDGVRHADPWDAADLLVDVVHRSYRCKDRMCAFLVRHVIDADFRDRLTPST